MSEIGMKPAIVEAEWNGAPTYLIALVDDGGIARRALWKFEGCKGATRPGTKYVAPCEFEAIPDVRAIWTTRMSWGWHSPNRDDAQKALEVLNQILEFHMRGEKVNESEKI